MTTDVLFGKGEAATPTAKAKEAVVTKWVGQMPEIVDSRFLEGGSLAFPLPPLVGREWGREVTHSDIPLAMDGVVLEDEKAKEKAESAKPGEPEEPEDPFARSARGMAGHPAWVALVRVAGWKVAWVEVPAWGWVLAAAVASLAACAVDRA